MYRFIAFFWGPVGGLFCVLRPGAGRSTEQGARAATLAHTPGAPATGAPAGAEGPAATGTAAARAPPGAMIRMNVDMVLVPVTVTDPMNRLVTGLEKEDFQVYENNGQQAIRSFASEDAPVSIGIIFDLSGSMTSKLLRARESILQFIKTANPEDEFFVIGFNDRPELIEDFHQFGRGHPGAAGHGAQRASHRAARRHLLRRGQDEGRAP